LAIAFTRTLVTSEADLPAANAIHVQYALAPLSAYPEIQPPPTVADANLSLFPLPHFSTLGIDFFDKLAAGLATALPPAYDLGSLNRFAKVGIKPGTRPSQIKDEKIIAVLRDAVPAADARIKKANYSTIVNGWSGNTKVTNFIKDPLVRAAVNQYGPAAHIAQEALYFSAKPESGPLNGAKKYVLTFPAGGLPPVDAFWSTTLYGPDFALVAGSDESIIRNRRNINPNQTEPSPGMDDTNHALFPRFSAELVATTLKDTPVVIVTGPRQCGDHIGSRFSRGQSRIHHHGRRYSSGRGTQRSDRVGARS
jgi:hypothetical protein